MTWTTWLGIGGIEKRKVEGRLVNLQDPVKIGGVLVPPSCRRLPRHMQISSLNGNSCLQVQFNHMNTNMA
jgi:hypothetical protein